MIDPKEKRADFLLEMYKQMLNDINRHIMVIWQSITVLAATLSLFSLLKDNIIQREIVISVITMASFWSWGHVIDASYWYNRNLAIIANIERLFLEREDLRRVHYYFGSHRKTNNMIFHLKMQRALAWGVLLVAWLTYLDTNIYSKLLSNTWTWTELTPVVVTILGLGFIIYVSSNRRKSYENFIENSPGISVDASIVRYGTGHQPYENKA